MLINRIRLSVFMKNYYIEYNPENTIKLLELFKEKEVMPSFVTEISRDMKQVKRPLIKSNIDNILLIIGSSRIDIRNDDIDEARSLQYNKDELLNFLEKFRFYFEKLKSAYKDLKVNRMAINLSILYEKNDVMSDNINIEACKLEEDWVLSNLSQKKVVDLPNFKKSQANVILNLINNDKLNIIFDINTINNPDNEFENVEIYSFFSDGIELINNLILN